MDFRGRIADLGLYLRGVGLDIQSQHADPAFRRFLETLDDLERGGLSGPVGAQYPKYLTPVNGKSHPVYRSERTESFN